MLITTEPSCCVCDAELEPDEHHRDESGRLCDACYEDLYVSTGKALPPITDAEADISMSMEILEVYAIDPFDKANWNKPLWCVYGLECFPRVLCCEISDGPPQQYSPTIWGYSIYKNKPGFRTLGINFNKWINNEGTQDTFFWDDIEHALAYLKLILTPSEPLESVREADDPPPDTRTLWDFFAEEHSLHLTEGQLSDIVDAVERYPDV